MSYFIAKSLRLSSFKRNICSRILGLRRLSHVGFESSSEDGDFQSDSDRELRFKLKRFRVERAQLLSKYPYNIFNDKVLNELVERKPTITLDGIKNFGPKGKVHSKDILEIITEHVSSLNLESKNSCSPIKTSMHRILAPKENSPIPDSLGRSLSKAWEEAVPRTPSAPKVPKKKRSVQFDVNSENMIEKTSLTDMQVNAAEIALAGKNVFITGTICMRFIVLRFCRNFLVSLRIWIINGKLIFFNLDIGCAGTGKSHTLRYIIQELRKIYGYEAVAVTAPTGVAAINIDGVTIHSFAGIGIGRDSDEKLLAKVQKSKLHNQRWKQTKVLIIDEISMVLPSLFNLLDRIARSLLEPKRPFGGLQVILLGDFLQLPPITIDGGITGMFITFLSSLHFINLISKLYNLFQLNRFRSTFLLSKLCMDRGRICRAEWNRFLERIY